jgi:GT2 family glycosyltransferase
MERLEFIGVPILVQGEKLLRHIKSIDVPLKRYYILDNSEGKDQSVADAIDEICENKPENIQEIVIVENSQNAGYPGSVNQMIRDNTDCNYWIMTGFDWWPKPKEYKKLFEYEHRWKDGAFLGAGCDDMCGFIFTPQLIEKIGLLDENFFPGYFEDNDYKRRMMVSNLRIPTIQLDAEHDRSSTLNSSNDFKKKNQFTFQKNYEYYIKKWGGGPNKEIYVYPFNKSVPIDYWKFDPIRRETMRW